MESLVNPVSAARRTERQRRVRVGVLTFALGSFISGIESAAGTTPSPDGEMKVGEVSPGAVHTPKVREGKVQGAEEALLEACCLADGSCVNALHTDCVNLGGDPQGPGTLCEALPRACRPLKWSQPPVYPTHPADTYTGWNDYSLWNMEATEPSVIVADDWQCIDGRPITDIHWWGSYIGWTSDTPPADVPAGFHIGIWTDVPVGQPSDETCCYCWNPPEVPPPTTCSPNPPDPETCWQWGGGQYQMCTYYPSSRCMGDHCEAIQPSAYSHPGALIWETFVPRTALNERAVECDFHPSVGSNDTCFKYDFDVPLSEWFYQDPAGASTTYWVSISADYQGIPPLFMWGWKTRQHFFGDDAVAVLEPNPPFIGSEFLSGSPIERPPGTSWDMAFTITSQAPQACCINQPSGPFCMDLPPDQCLVQGIPQGPGTACSLVRIACCLQDGSCVDVDPQCCDDLGGTPSPFTAACMGDNDGNGVDDACEPPCHPDSRGLGCSLTICPNEPETCVPTKVLCVGPGICTVIECQCQRGDFCHVDLDARQQPTCLGNCPLGQVCNQVATTEPDQGVIYTCVCEPAPEACCDPFTGICEDMDPVLCAAIDRNPQGPGTGCVDTVRACCLPNGGCVEITHTSCVQQGGDPQGPGTICDLRICPLIKWSQPPTFNPASPHPECFWGWDELSRFAAQQIVADDWLCDDEKPVKDVHWWGSYIGWSGVEPPAIAPSDFHIGLWTDVPFMPPGFSHPGIMIAEWVVPRVALNERPVACDFHPAFMPTPDGCFRYDWEVPYGQWFYQEAACNIYWISISARYFLPVEPQFPWGWKTREHLFNDDAVRIFAPTAPVPGMPFMFGEPIRDPQDTSWDLAFVLTTCETKPYADIYPQTSGDGNVDLDDILCVLDGFYDAAWCPGADIYPCEPDGNIDLDDILAVLDAFAGFPACPPPCR